MMNQKGNSRLDAALKMLLIAFISLLAFSSGVYFGKQMSDNEYQLKSLETDFKEAPQVADGKAVEKHADARPEDALVDEDISALSDKLVNAEKTDKGERRSVASTTDAAADKAAGVHEAAPAKDPVKSKTVMKVSPAAAKNPARPDLHEAQAVADRVARNATPTEGVEPKTTPRAPQSLPRSVGGPSAGEFTVQVASYPNSEEAKARADALTQKGFAAYPVEATVNGKTWYRVSVGSFKTAKEAGIYRAQLLKQAELKSAIVQKIDR